MEPTDGNSEENNFNQVPTPMPETVTPPQPQPQTFQQPVQTVPQPVTQDVQPAAPQFQPMDNNPAVQSGEQPKKNNKMLIIGIVAGVLLLLAVVIAVVMAVSAGQSSTKTGKDNVASSAKSDVVVPAGYKRVGETAFGYINVPKEWVKFQEIGAAADTMMQYSDGAGFTVVTVTKYNQGYTLDELTSMLLGSMASGPAPTKSTAQVDGHTAKLLSQDYSSTQGKILDTYVFEETKQIATISIEYAPADKSIATNIINSYRLSN